MKHEEVKVLSMRPGHTAGATCSCGWHSHRQTFDDHIEDLENDDDYLTPEGYDDSPDQGVHRYDGGGTFF